MTPYSPALAGYLLVVLGLAFVVVVAALGSAAAVVVHSRRVRLGRRQSLRAFYGPRLALHH